MHELALRLCEMGCSDGHDHGGTHDEELGSSQHALLQACIEKIDMIAQELVDRLDFCNLGLEITPVGLEDFARDKGEDLADKDEHAGAQGEYTRFPALHIGMTAIVSPARRLVVEPHGR